MKYNREDELRSRLNKFLVSSFDLPEDDYYSAMSVESFVRLKSALSDINNILTLKVTLGFCRWLAAHYSLDNADAEQLESMALGAKPNANGYDVWLGYPVAFVGEVKCNIPINGSSVYGSAQRAGIERDISGLVNGKRKAPMITESLPKYIAFLDVPEVRAANEHLMKVSRICRDYLLFSDNNADLKRTDVVYGIYISIDA